MKSLYYINAMKGAFWASENIPKIEKRMSKEKFVSMFSQEDEKKFKNSGQYVNILFKNGKFICEIKE